MTLIVCGFFIAAHKGGIQMLGYAERLKKRLLAKGAVEAITELSRKLEQADKNGKELKEVLEEHKPKKKGKGLLAFWF